MLPDSKWWSNQMFYRVDWEGQERSWVATKDILGDSWVIIDRVASPIFRVVWFWEPAIIGGRGCHIHPEHYWGPPPQNAQSFNPNAYRLASWNIQTMCILPTLTFYGRSQALYSVILHFNSFLIDHLDLPFIWSIHEFSPLFWLWFWILSWIL